MSRKRIAYWRALILGLGVSFCVPATGLAATVLPQSSGPQFSIQGNETRIVVPLARPISIQAAIDGSPAGLIVDLPPGAAGYGLLTGRGQGLVRDFQIRPGNQGVNRIVFTLAKPAVIAGVRTVPGERGKAAIAIIELAAADPIAMHAMAGVVYRSQISAAATQTADMTPPASIATLLEPPGPHILMLKNPPPEHAVAPAPSVVASLPPVTVSAPLVPVAVSRIVPARPAPSIASIISPKRTIVIDAGHGGIDPGAESIAGYHEKEVTLATARMLRQVLEQTGRYNIVLTRDSDVYLKLHERVERARAAHGNLFVSLHADSIAGGIQAASDRITRGASIYTLSETASDAASERYAQRENRADAIGGVDLGDQSDDVAGILVDLTVRETVNEGNRFAGMLVDSLEKQGVSLLPRAPHRSAGFAVLKSPDIPSVLIEMGYLSDISDARALADPRHQMQIAKAIAEGIERYFAWLQISRS